MKKYLFLVFTLLYLNNTKAQDPIFSQNLSTRTYLNPAIAGTDSTLVLSAGYRLQWYEKGNHKTTYSTSHFSADQYVHFLREGIGLDFLHDVAGNALTTSNINFSYAPHFEILDHRISIQPSISIGYFEKTIQWSQFTFGNQIDPATGFIYTNNGSFETKKKSNLDLSAGVFMYSRKIYGGIALKHFNQPDEGILGYSALPYNLILHAGANFNFDKDVHRNLIISPNIVLKFQQNFTETALGITTKYKWFLLGVNYRFEDAVIFNAGFQNRFLKVGYTYDYTTSLLTNNATKGTHELQLSWFLHYQKKTCKIKTIRFI
jgi:type IX secretion system PorP/SprF family membrane protein